MQKDNNGFSFTYSAPTDKERREIESIRRQYAAADKKESDLDRLRSLHSRVYGSAASLSLASGIVGLLMFGGGMALVLEFGRLALGIILAVLGILPIAAAYPIYKSVMERGRKKHGEEILRLSDRLLGE